MIKYYVKEGKEVKEVKIGSVIRVQTKTKTPFGEGITSIDVVVTKKNIPVLLKEGVLYTKKSKDLTIESYIEKVAKKWNLNIEDTTVFIDIIAQYDKFMALYLLLKAASEEAMYNYKGTSCAVIFMSSGKIDLYSNYRELPSHTLMFPTKEDANKAIEVLGSLYKKVYDS